MLLVSVLRVRTAMASSWGVTRPRRKEVSRGASESSESGEVVWICSWAASRWRFKFFCCFPVFPIAFAVVDGGVKVERESFATSTSELSLGHRGLSRSPRHSSSVLQM